MPTIADVVDEVRAGRAERLSRRWQRAVAARQGKARRAALSPADAAELVAVEQAVSAAELLARRQGFDRLSALRVAAEEAPPAAGEFVAVYRIADAAGDPLMARLCVRVVRRDGAWRPAPNCFLVWLTDGSGRPHKRVRDAVKYAVERVG